MKTLSDNLDIKLETTGMQEGYVITTIYHGGIGVFSGRSYIPGDDSSLVVNINDIVCQNRSKYDYLKLNDEGELKSIPNTSYYSGGVLLWTRFVKGLISTYGVTIKQDSSLYNSNETVITGYDYPNRDIRPSMIENNYDSFMGRLMLGCNWFDNREDEEGSFDSLLLPHLPNIPTKKFGFGLQLCHKTATGSSYAIRTKIGQDVSLGEASPLEAAMTFMTIADFIDSGASVSSDYDTSIYLKLQGSSGDEFGDWVEGLTWYKGHVLASEIKVLGEKDGVTTELGTYDYGATYKVYMRRYIYSNPDCDWNWSLINDGNLEVFVTNWGSSSVVNNQMQTYESNYGRVEIPKSSQAEAQYDHLYAEPVFSETTDTRTDPDTYIGTCPIAIIDNCYSRYYLAWNDRYGDIMSQPFDGKVEYTEDFERNEMKDYKLRRRVIHNELQPKWKLNTKWLSEDIYPMYESIFTSPYLLLYDTETDKSWNVILTDSEYKEKTFNTEKTLFNLEINVEANTKQNYIF